MAEGKDSRRSENKAKDEKRWFNFIYSIVIPVVKLIYPVRCKGTENIPEGPAVVCGNHSNLVDPLLAAAAFGKRTFMHFIAKVELSTVPVIGWVLRKCGVCFVNRGESDIGAMRSMMRYLKRGDKIFIFPEGTRAGEDNMVDAKTGAVGVAMFACIAGSTVLQGSVTALTTIPTCIATFLAISLLATRLGQKKGMVIGSIGGIVVNLALGALWLFGDPTTMTSDPQTGALHWGYFLILHIVLSIFQGGFQGISGNIVIPMTTDCADYEVYRTGRYVPGLMGTLFSFVDKIISSLAPLIAGLVFAACGFTDHNPVMGDIVTPQLRLGVAFLAYGILILGLICNLIAMKFYPLSKEKMAELQNEIVAIKEKAMAEGNA